MTTLFTCITHLTNSMYLILKHHIELCINEYLQQKTYSNIEYKLTYMC